MFPRLFLFLALCCAISGAVEAAGKGQRKATGGRKAVRALRAEPAVAMAPTAPAQGSDWETVRASYGLLIHVAGTGGVQNVNSWLPSYEGSDARTVELSNPHMAAADAFGNIYIADKESHSILKVAPDGTVHTVAGTHTAGYNGDGPALAAQLDSPNGVFVLADGVFYIVDLMNRRIRRVGTDGQLTTMVEESAGLLFGRALWVSPDEQLIYFAGRNSESSPSLKRWTPSGGVEVVTSGFTSVGNITVDHDGLPIVTEDIGNRVYRILPDGTQVLIAGNGTTSGGGDGFPAIHTGLDRVRGVACLPGGGFFLATQKGAHIWYVDSIGIIHKMMDCARSGHISSGNNQLYSTSGVKMSEPRAITVASNGDLIITASDYGEVRVVKCVAPPSAPARAVLEQTPEESFSLQWSGIPWQSYLIEHSPNLLPDSWSVLGVHTSEPDEDSLHALPAPGSATAGFYRLRMPRW